MAATVGNEYSSYFYEVLNELLIFDLYNFLRYCLPIKQSHRYDVVKRLTPILATIATLSDEAKIALDNTIYKDIKDLTENPPPMEWLNVALRNMLLSRLPSYLSQAKNNYLIWSRDQRLKNKSLMMCLKCKKTINV